MVIKTVTLLNIDSWFNSNMLLNTFFNSHCFSWKTSPASLLLHRPIHQEPDAATLGLMCQNSQSLRWTWRSMETIIELLRTFKPLQLPPFLTKLISYNVDSWLKGRGRDGGSTFLLENLHCFTSTISTGPSDLSAFYHYFCLTHLEKNQQLKFDDHRGLYVALLGAKKKTERICFSACVLLSLKSISGDFEL